MMALGQGRSKKEARTEAAVAIKLSIKVEELPAVSKSFKSTMSQKRKVNKRTPKSRAKKMT